MNSIFFKHPELAGQHALLAPSKSAWLRYDDEKLAKFWETHRAAEEGTATHAFASTCIQRNQRLPRNNLTLNMFVNDAIGYHMASEQSLIYPRSKKCFGTADAIMFRDGVLRVHDLKTGATPAHMDQLLIYAALFCLEYDINPKDITTVLRIYQNCERVEDEPSAEDVSTTMDIIVDKCKKLDAMEAEEA